jgi:hypothetical protein
VTVVIDQHGAALDVGGGLERRQDEDRAHHGQNADEHDHEDQLDQGECALPIDKHSRFPARR